MNTIPNLGYTFRNEALLETALTHKSFRNGDRSSGNLNNERLEFLGDAFFDAAVGEELYRRLPDATEGTLTRLRAQIVCEATLGSVSRQLGVGKYLFLSAGEEKQGGRNKLSILSDTLEAIIGAVYLDSDWETVNALVLHHFRPSIEQAVAGTLLPDYKTRLQEYLQARGILDIAYLEDSETGPDHNKVFTISVYTYGQKQGTGVGKTKKEAEQKAAQQALTALENQ